jgi:hypothetical protein
MRILALLFLCAIARGDTSVEKPDPKRDVLSVCEKYRLAMEARDVPALIALAHPKYHEDAGTPSPDDDHDYAGLKEILTTRFRSITKVTLKLTYRKVTVDGTRARVEVQRDGTFTMGGREMRSQDTYNMDFERDGKRWLITGGM